MSSSSDIFDRLSMFRNPASSGSDDDPDDQRPARPKMDPATSRVKRCLFGRGNHEENIRFAKRELEKSIAESKRKWNFDFENERPMEGRFEWQSSPYPIFKKKNTENVENLKPSENPSSKNEHTSTSSDDQNCDLGNTNVEAEQASDPNPEAAASGAAANALPASSSSTSNQRTSSRQSSIAGKPSFILINVKGWLIIDIHPNHFKRPINR